MASLLPATHLVAEEDRTTLIEFVNKAGKCPGRISQHPIRNSSWGRRSIQRASLAALFSALTVLIAVLTCYRGLGRRVPVRRGSGGRRLGTYEDSEGAGDHVLAELIGACLHVDADMGYLAGGSPVHDAIEAGMASSVEGRQGGAGSSSSDLISPFFDSWTSLTSGAELHESASGEWFLSSESPYLQVTTPPDGHSQPLASLHSNSSSQLGVSSAPLQSASSFEDSTKKEDQIGVQPRRRGRKRRQKGESGETIEEPKVPKRRRMNSRVGMGYRSVAKSNLPGFSSVSVSSMHETSESRRALGVLGTFIRDSAIASAISEEANDTSTQPLRHLKDGILGSSSASLSHSEGSSSSAAQQASLPPPASVMPFGSHLYYRLPVLASGSLRRTFNYEFVTKHRPFDRLPIRAVRLMRKYLSKPGLHINEAQELLAASERVANYVAHTQHTSLYSSPLPDAVDGFGRRYIMLEAIFCTIQVLGPAMVADRWWPQFAERIAAEYPKVHASIYPKRRVWFNLACRLISALELLKNGVRPSLEDTVQLKRDLFSSELSTNYFQSPMWDEWRAMDDAGTSTSGRRSKEHALLPRPVRTDKQRERAGAAAEIAIAGAAAAAAAGDAQSFTTFDKS
ncbi:hypothetical protein Efla_002547 [Eimeria flavescens]